MTYLDTHVVIWMASGKPERLGRESAERVRVDDLAVSPAVLLELAFLDQIGRLDARPHEVIEMLAADTGLRLCELSFRRVVESAIEQGWARDPFDRLIVGQAAANKAPLITKDRHILRHYKHAVW